MMYANIYKWTVGLFLVRKTGLGKGIVGPTSQPRWDNMVKQDFGSQSIYAKLQLVYAWWTCRDDTQIGFHTRMGQEMA